MQGSARKDVVFGPARVYTVAVPGPKWKSWFICVSEHLGGSALLIRRAEDYTDSDPAMSMLG